MAVITETPSGLHLSSTHSWVTLLLFLTVPFIVSTIATAFYSAYFDKLSHIPGPKLWVAFPILRYIAAIRGDLDSKLRDLHAKHGKAVRFSPSEVSFNVGQAWNDIYGFKNSPELPKPSKRTEPGRPPSIINANNADHSRMRRALAHGFSDRALREQESLMQGYINMLVSQITDAALSEKPTNMVKWLNFTTFDIIGDLSFGKSFGCLASGDYHFFIENNLKIIQGIPYITLMNEYPFLRKLIRPFIAPKLMKARNEMFEYSRTTVTERLNDDKKQGRWDFIDALTKNDIVRGEELYGNSNTLIFAGSETTATLLSGVTYYLLKNPRVKEKVVTEVRSTFKDESEINLVNVNSILPYLNAVLEEGLRLYPPVPSGFSRVTTHDMAICDVPIPKGVEVMTHQTSIHWSETNFTRPKEFLPERWLPEAKEPGSEFYNDDRSAVQPFSFGPRNCIGKNLANSEMRLVLARLLWNFDFELCKESENWTDQKSFTLWEKPALMCRVKLSEKASAS